MSGKSPQTKSKSSYELEQELALELENKGHTCIQWRGVNSEFIWWCRKLECTQHEEDKLAEEIQFQHNQMLAQIRELKRQGHICLALPDIYPAQFSWCQNTPCKS